MSEEPKLYGLSYATRLVPDGTGEVIFKHTLTSRVGWDQSVPPKWFLAEVQPHLDNAHWLEVAERFAEIAYSSGERSCDITLIRSGTSMYLEVFARGLTSGEAARALRFGRRRSHTCDSYEVGEGRAMWAEFTPVP